VRKDRAPFFGGPVTDLVVRSGADARLSSARDTYREMLLQIARDYAGLPDARTLTIGEIVFFYEGLRPELIKHTRSRPEPSANKSRKPRKHGR
jgi:hypothetical protein